MIDYAKLSGLAEADIDNLRAEGIDLTPEEIVEINTLAWQVEEPQTRQHLARGVPVEVAGVYLWPLSLYAQDWFARVGSNLKSETLRGAALAYAMAHQYDEGEPLAMGIDTAAKTVKQWKRSLRCTWGELAIAVSYVLAQEDDAEQRPTESGGMTLGDFSAFLASACGGDPEFWERRCATGYTHAVLDAIVRQNAAEGKSSAGDPRIKADAALGWAVSKVRISRGLQPPPDGWIIEDGELVKDEDNVET